MVIRPCSTSKLSCSTFVMVAIQFVVHDALDTTL